MQHKNTIIAQKLETVRIVYSALIPVQAKTQNEWYFACERVIVSIAIAT